MAMKYSFWHGVMNYVLYRRLMFFIGFLLYWKESLSRSLDPITKKLIGWVFYPVIWLVEKCDVVFLFVWFDWPLFFLTVGGSLLWSGLFFWVKKRKKISSEIKIKRKFHTFRATFYSKEKCKQRCCYPPYCLFSFLHRRQF